MPYIGKEPVAGNFVLLDSITTSATATYALTKDSVAYSPESARNMLVSLNGVTQAPETAFTVSGSNITFSSALTSSDVIDYILVLGDVLSVGTPSDGTVGTSQMSYPLDNFSSTGIDDNATSTAITIDSSENVGIGTTSPSGILDVSGNFVVDTATGDTTPFVKAFRATTGNNRPIFQTESSVGVTATFAGDGNVGIGTTSPNRRLQIGDHSGAQEALSIQASTTGKSDIFLGDGTGASEYAGLVRYDHASDFMSFWTASSESARIDSSGNLLVGNTTGALGTAGVSLRGSWIRAVRDGDIALQLNRLTSDGTIADFRKDGTTVGTIGTEGGDMAIGNDDVGLQFINGGQAIRGFNMATNTRIDAQVDLGMSTTRFKDLYLSGGAYLGGTAAANQLDDYEEGNWIPTASSGFTGLSYDASNCRYTKIGNTVHLHGEIGTITGQTAATFVVGGLPFSVASGVEGSFAVMYNEINIDTNYTQLVGYAQASENKFRLYECGDSQSWSAVRGNQTSSSTDLIFSITYETS